MSDDVHVGDVQPREGRGGFTWVCRCGTRPDADTFWATFDRAATALARHIHKATATPSEDKP